MAEMIFRFISGEEVMRTNDIANILSYLCWKDIMRARVSKKWREAAKQSIVPPTIFHIDSVRSYNAMRVMSTALPNMEQLSISNLGHENMYSIGKDPDEEMAQRTANLPSHDINIISSFRKLRVMHMCNALLNGSFPVLFNFQLLEKLSVQFCNYLTFDLDMLKGLPSLRELDCFGNPRLTGDLSSLRVLKGTLESVIIRCRDICGNLMDLADFPHMEELDLRCSSVTGDIRHISEHDFPALESLALPRTVCGGTYYLCQCISELPSLMHTIHLLLQHIPTLFEKDRLPRAFGWSLSKQSPDWYARDCRNGNPTPMPPFRLQLIQAGKRRGWSWCTFYGDHLCEINWLDPEPSRESSDYETYVEDLQRIEQHISFYRGFHEPPTEMEYRRLCDGLKQRQRD
eukprot:scaffold37414_cov255-Skeletonema_dohrnii-CCMP3373.AAC.1